MEDHHAASARFGILALDEQVNAVSHYDVFDYIAAAKDHYAKVGIAADYIDSLFR